MQTRYVGEDGVKIVVEKNERYIVNKTAGIVSGNQKGEVTCILQMYVCVK